MTRSKITIVDRAGKPLAVGQFIKVMTWESLQPKVVEGKIEILKPEYRAAILRLTKPTRETRPSDVHYIHVTVDVLIGEQLYVLLPGEFVGDVYVCEKKVVEVRPYHVSGAYTYESWVEIIEDEQALEMAQALEMSHRKETASPVTEIEALERALDEARSARGTAIAALEESGHDRAQLSRDISDLDIEVDELERKLQQLGRHP